MSGPAQAGVAALSPAELRRANRRKIPWTMRFPGPVFSKEVWMLGKRPSTAWLRLVHVAVLLLVVTIVFVNLRDVSGGDGASAGLQRYQQLAPGLTVAVVWVEFVMLGLIAVALAAPAVCEEKQMGTLGTLLTTPLKAWQIVLGKGLGRIVELMVLALVPLPLLLALRSFGGVTAEALATTTATCLVNAVLAVQVGIFVSTVSRRAIGAILLSFILLGVVMFGPMLVVWAVIMIQTVARGGGGAPPGPAMTVFFASSAPAMLFLQCFHYFFNESMGAPITMPVRDLWAMHMGYSVALCVLFFGLSCVALRRVMDREGEGRAQKADAVVAVAAAATPEVVADAGAEAVAGAGAGALPKSPRRSRRRAPEGVSRVVGDAPVAWRELQQGVLRSKVLTVIAGLMLAGLMLFIYYVAAFHEPVQQVLTAVGAAATLIACAVMSTGSIAQERESRTLDALLCTPLSAWDIVWGKFLGSARRASVGLILVLGHILVSGVGAIPGGAVCKVIDSFVPRIGGRNIDPDLANPIALLHVAMILGSSMAFLLAAGVLFSARFKKSVIAAVFNIGLMLGLWLGTPLVVFIMTEVTFGSSNGLGEFLQNTVMTTNPVVMSVIAVDGAMNVEWSSGGSASRSLSYDMPGGNWDVVEFTLGMGVVTALYVAGAWMALRRAAWVIGGPTSRRR